jgi:hypothetical protein
MRKLLYSLLILAALPIFGQQATLNTPNARSSETKIVIVDFSVKRDCACAYIVAEYQDASSNATHQTTYNVPDSNVPALTLQGLVGAMLVTRATETGVNTRKMSFRILGYLSDNGALTGVTLSAEKVDMLPDAMQFAATPATEQSNDTARSDQ